MARKPREARGPDKSCRPTSCSVRGLTTETAGPRPQPEAACSEPVPAPGSSRCQRPSLQVCLVQGQWWRVGEALSGWRWATLTVTAARVAQKGLGAGKGWPAGQVLHAMDLLLWGQVSFAPGVRVPSRKKCFWGLRMQGLLWSIGPDGWCWGVGGA